VRKLAEWNRPVWWPMILVALLALTLVAIGWRSLRRRERMNARGEVLA
jgi:membrane protein implicated in regulation of membrane protease activity